MTENLLPHDMDEILAGNKSIKIESNYQKPDYTQQSNYQKPDYMQQSNYQKPDYMQQSNYQKPDYTQQSNYQKPDYNSLNNQRSNYRTNNAIIEEKITKAPEIKKKNVFTKISNNISNRPKCYLILIIILIIIILILFIYYKGILFIGPYCPNNIRSNAYKNKMSNKTTGEISPISLKDSLKT